MRPSKINPPQTKPNFGYSITTTTKKRKSKTKDPNYSFLLHFFDTWNNLLRQTNEEKKKERNEERKINCLPTYKLFCHSAPTNTRRNKNREPKWINNTPDAVDCISPNHVEKKNTFWFHIFPIFSLTLHNTLSSWTNNFNCEKKNNLKNLLINSSFLLIEIVFFTVDWQLSVRVSYTRFLRPSDAIALHFVTAVLGALASWNRLCRMKLSLSLQMTHIPLLRSNSLAFVFFFENKSPKLNRAHIFQTRFKMALKHPAMTVEGCRRLHFCRNRFHFHVFFCDAFQQRE